MAGVDPGARADLKADVLIVGTGALATLYAARLAAAGTRVCLLGSWPEGLAALRAEGARVVEADGSERAWPVCVTDDPRRVAGARAALVLVKSWQTAQAATRLSACLDPQGVALTLQNGLGNREILVQHLGAERVGLGVTTGGATLLGPGRVRAGGAGTVTLERHPRLAALEHLLRSAGFDVETVADARSIVWGKLAINAAINPLTALLDVPNGELLERPTAREMMADLARETQAVAAAQSIPLPYADAAAAAEQVARRTAANLSSMLQDVRRGAPTEIDAICGAVARHGQALGVATPANLACWRLVRALGHAGA